ncbi:MAG: divalent-cation tolerance protein CutA [Pseudomonadota bacterium]
MDEETKLCLIYTTHKSEKDAEVLAEKLVRSGHLVCANVFAAGKSVYMWNGGVNVDDEAFAIFKTTPDKLYALEEEYLKEHPYDTPCFIVINSKHVNLEYLSWARS